ncbi:MAG: hypothetical protein J6R77_06865, partial [Clostridia bacterium]|nr:hypothetical protein [Clostridia bacterium]
LKTTLEEVSGEREKLETVLACMRDAVFTFYANGKLLHWNTSAEKLYNAGKDEPVSKTDVTLDECFEYMDIPLQRDGTGLKLMSPDAVAERSKDGLVFRDRIFGGRVFDVSFGIIRYVEGGRMARGCILIAHDVTGRYELDESRREFVANVSHELRTPLTSIKGATETIMSDPEMEEEMREYFLELVLSESDRMTRIVADLLVQYARALENSMGSNVETLYRLMDDGAEALVFKVADDPRVVRIPLKDLQLKSQVLVAGILRGRETIIPTGADTILPEDRVVVITAGRRLNDLADILK